MLKEKLKIDGKITLGAASGIIGSLILNVVNYVLFLLDLEKWHIFHIAALAYFKVEDVETLPALFVGAISHLATVGLLGVIICYVLHYTGRDFLLGANSRSK